MKKLAEKDNSKALKKPNESDEVESSEFNMNYSREENLGVGHGGGDKGGGLKRQRIHSD